MTEETKNGVSNAIVLADIVDLAELDTGAASDEGAEIELVHPTTGAKLGLFAKVLGKHSQVFRDIQRDRVNARLRREQGGFRSSAANNLTAEQIEAEAVELLIACTVDWFTRSKDAKGNVVEKPGWPFGKEQLVFNTQNALKVYSVLWVRDQIDNAIGDLGNFIKG